MLVQESTKDRPDSINLMIEEDLVWKISKGIRIFG